MLTQCQIKGIIDLLFINLKSIAFLQQLQQRQPPPPLKLQLQPQPPPRPPQLQQT